MNEEEFNEKLLKLLNQIKPDKKIIIQFIDEHSDLKPNDSVLTAACKWGDIEIIELLIKNGAEVCNNTDALIIACQWQEINIVKLLIENGVNVKDNAGAFSIACDEGDKEIIELLLNFGAKTSYENIMHICDHGFLDVIKIMLE